jgi:hypothetical protein
LLAKWRRAGTEALAGSFYRLPSRTIRAVTPTGRGIAMENQATVFDAPTSANITVMSKKRPREYLTDAEIERLMAGCGEPAAR